MTCIPFRTAASAAANPPTPAPMMTASAFISSDFVSTPIEGPNASRYLFGPDSEVIPGVASPIYLIKLLRSIRSPKASHEDPVPTSEEHVPPYRSFRED